MTKGQDFEKVLEYIEKNVEGYPLTDLVMKNFSDPKIIWIDHYKDIFNRVGQDFQSQKTTMNLILAKKTPPFLYPASDMVQEFETPNVFYNTPVLNCLYNCEYCFLQGMYPSGNLVIFANENDFFMAINNPETKSAINIVLIILLVFIF